MPDTTTTPSLTIAIDGDTAPLERQLSDVAKIGARFGSALSNSLADVALRGKGLGDVLRSLALQLSQIALKAAFKPVTDSIGSSLAGLITGSALSSSAAGGVAFAKGGVLQSGLPVPFASGGVISSPIAFPLAGNRTGLAGERGPEAILPLARGPDGSLGVRTSGGGALNVTFNVTATDADSFRRSESQITALLARAVSHGQRNL